MKIVLFTAGTACLTSHSPGNSHVCTCTRNQAINDPKRKIWIVVFCISGTASSNCVPSVSKISECPFRMPQVFRAGVRCAFHGEKISVWISSVLLARLFSAWNVFFFFVCVLFLLICPLFSSSMIYYLFYKCFYISQQVFTCFIEYASLSAVT